MDTATRFRRTVISWAAGDADAPAPAESAAARELIRALGTDGVQQVIVDRGDLRAFRVFPRQPAQRERAVEAQLRCFMGTIGGRKEHYARALAEALDPNRPPPSLDGLLSHL
ncbi:hypothetical protein [Streptomyces sp. NPDC006270]|uniref:hypothetical protein n=1 Tax=Streptomyces sp. NPDC006270 TaxID=3364741 RepID=UPI00368F5FCA